MPDDKIPLYFQFFNEIGIINQLSTTMVESTMPKGLLISHFGVLNHLVRVGDGSTPLKLASAFQVPKTTMTHTLSGLVEHGLAEFKPNPKDGRSKTVWITKEGHEFRLQTIEKLAPLFQPLVKAIPPERIAEMLPTLGEIRIFLDEMRNE